MQLLLAFRERTTPQKEHQRRFPKALKWNRVYASLVFMYEKLCRFGLLYSDDTITYPINSPETTALLRKYRLQ